MASTDMAGRTTFGERQKIVDAFMRFDTDSSGSLEHEEVLHILTRATGKQMSVDEAKRFLKRFDANMDGKLNVIEFADAFKAMGATESKTKMKMSEWKALKEFDKDGSGVLEREELMQILTHSSGKAKGMSNEDAREFIDLFDEDQNGNIDASEFAKFYHSLLGGDGGSGAQARAKEVEAKGKKGKKK